MVDRRRIGVAALVSASGCTLLTSFDGLTGGAPDGGVPSEAAPLDAIVDDAPGARDVSNPSDGQPSDAATDAATGPRRWRKLAVNGPPPRHSTRMAYDPAHRVVVLFGGGVTGSDAFNDTWIWDGTTWQDRSPTVSPFPRRAPRLAYDSARGSVFLFGGNGATTPPDQWTWDGTLWTQRASTTHPPNLHGSKIAF